MGLQPIKTTTSGGIPVFVNVFEVYTGGFTLVTTGLTSGDVLVEGTPVKVDEVARTMTVSKTARLYSSATNTDTDYDVYKGHQLQVGDNLSASVGGAAYAITAIDKTTNATHDVITVGTTLGVTLSAKDPLYDSSAAGAAAGAIEVAPNGLLYNEVVVGSYESGSVVRWGEAYANRIPALIDDLKTTMPKIEFNLSY